MANNETMANSTERMVVLGGFGGWLSDDSKFDGYRSRGDTWASTDGATWNLLGKSNLNLKV